MNKMNGICSLNAKWDIQKADLETFIQALNSTPQNNDEKVILEYIDNRSIPETADFCKKNKITMRNGIVFSACDIESLIENGSNEADEDLCLIAKGILNNEEFTRI